MSAKEMWNNAYKNTEMSNSKVEEDEKTINYHLEQKVEQLENIRKEAIEYVRNNFQQNIITGSEYLIGYSPCTDLLNILNKGSNKE